MKQSSDVFFFFLILECAVVVGAVGYVENLAFYRMKQDLIEVYEGSCTKFTLSPKLPKNKGGKKEEMNS